MITTLYTYVFLDEEVDNVHVSRCKIFSCAGAAGRRPCGSRYTQQSLKRKATYHNIIGAKNDKEGKQKSYDKDTKKIKKVSKRKRSGGRRG